MKKDFLTTKRIKGSLIWIGLQILSYIFKKILENYSNITLNNIIMENYGLIISCTILISIVVLLVYWKIKDFFSEYKLTIKRLNSGVYAANQLANLQQVILDKNRERMFWLNETELSQIMTKEEWEFYKTYNYKADFTIQTFNPSTK